MPQDFFQLKWELHFLPVHSLAPRVSQRGIPLSLEGNSLPVTVSIKPQSGANYLQGQSGTGSWVLRAEKEEKVNWLLAVSNFNLICTCRAPCKTQMNLTGGPIYLGIQRYREEVNPLRSCQEASWRGWGFVSMPIHSMGLGTSVCHAFSSYKNTFSYGDSQILLPLSCR